MQLYVSAKRPYSGTMCVGQSIISFVHKCIIRGCNVEHDPQGSLSTTQVLHNELCTSNKVIKDIIYSTQHTQKFHITYYAFTKLREIVAIDSV